MVRGVRAHVARQASARRAASCVWGAALAGPWRWEAGVGALGGHALPLPRRLAAGTVFGGHSSLAKLEKPIFFNALVYHFVPVVGRGFYLYIWIGYATP